MKIALIDNTRVEAKPKQEAICPCCFNPVISKCGNQKVWHWAHKSLTNCDNWWEAETEWHRNWKDNFPIDWQERIQFDEKTNERHIADVLTIHNLVLEFQHSHIDPIERQKREKFYKNMIWVVDGTRLQKDYPRFQKKMGEFKLTKQQGVFLVDFVDEAFPKSWLKSSVPVIFDFKGLSGDESDQYKTILWCLLPQTDSFSGLIVGFKKSDFIQIVKSRGQLFADRTESQEEKVTKINQLQINFAKRESIYYLQKGRWVKRGRL
ncbi:MAG: competence protein CoiA family protein [Saprospiraceae bacterium]|nr:competence protein CoiA family protein [Saprospiraceae bacterium]